MVKQRGTLFTVLVPFKGDPDFFKWTPSHYTTVFPHADLKDNEIKLEFKVLNTQKFDLDTSVESQVNDINQYLSWVKEDVESFSKQLETDIRRAIKERKNSFEAGRRHTKNSKIPIRKNKPVRTSKASQQNKGVSDKLSQPEYDVFISHASDDKDEFVRPLARALQNKGLEIWFDEFSLKLGDSLREKIDYGLANSRYGIVVLSHAFFSKDWPKKELDGLVSREVAGRKVILPIWHHIDKEEVAKYSPILAGRIAANSNRGVDEVVLKIMEVFEE